MVHQVGNQYIVNSWCTVRKTLSSFYPCCIFEQQRMLIIIFIINKNFIPNKFVQLKSTYIRLRMGYIHVTSRCYSHATKNNYVSSVCLVRLVQNSEALRRARSYEIWQLQNAILQWRAPVSLKWNLSFRAKIHLNLPLSTNFCSSLEYLAPVNCRLLAHKLIYWTRNSARCYGSAVVEIIVNSESATTMLLHVLRLVLNRNRFYKKNGYFILDHLVYLRKQVTANKASFCLNNLSSKVGWNVLCAYNTHSFHPTKSNFFFVY